MGTVGKQAPSFAPLYNIFRAINLGKFLDRKITSHQYFTDVNIRNETEKQWSGRI